MERCFVVGCPRSGTTLLQTMLAQHPAIFTIPESHFFLKIRGRFGSRSRWPFVSPRAAARAIDALIAVCGSPPGVRRVPRWWLGRGRYASNFARILDAAARSSEATIWVEKSPVHLHYIDVIRRGVPEARFIHVLRDGRDVVASLVDLCERHPELWVAQLVGRGVAPPEKRDLIDAAAARWNADLHRSLERAGDVGHLLVFYEDLLVETRRVLEKVSTFLGVDYHPAMERHWESANQVIGPRADLFHMEKAFQPVEDRRLQRFREVFDEVEREQVVSRLLYGGDPRAAQRAMATGDSSAGDEGPTSTARS